MLNDGGWAKPSHHLKVLGERMNVIRCGFREQVKDTWRIAFYAGMVMVAIIIARALSVTHDVALGIVCGAAGGAIGHWRATGPASMRLRKGFVQYAISWFETKGYISCSGDKELIPKLPRVLRFNSQNIKFNNNDDLTVIVTGPYYMLKNFSKRYD